MQIYERNEATLQAEQAALERQSNGRGTDAPMLELQSGSTMVRILPPYSAAGVFFRQVFKHWVNMGKGKQAEIFACPAVEANLPCAVCQKGQELTDTRDEVKMKFARDLRPQNRFLYNVLVHSAPGDRRGVVPEFGKVYVMEAGVMVHRQIISLDQDPAAGWSDVTNPQAGVNLIIKKTGSKLDTKYDVNPHGSGRTDMYADCAARGVDHNSLTLINLDEVYAIPDQEKVEEVAASINVGGAFPGGAAPTPRPALKTVSPAAAASAPTAPVTATPAPVAAPAPQPLPAAAPAMVASQPPVVAGSGEGAQPVPVPPVVPAPPE